MSFQRQKSKKPPKNYKTLYCAINIKVERIMEANTEVNGSKIVHIKCLMCFSVLKNKSKSYGFLSQIFEAEKGIQLLTACLPLSVHLFGKCQIKPTDQRVH